MTTAMTIERDEVLSYIRDMRALLDEVDEAEKQMRDKLSSADMNDLPDSAFAYIEPGGKKDASGKTTPRSLRHFPIHDVAHVRNALARASQSPFGEKAMPKIRAAAKKFGIEVSDKNGAEDEKNEERELNMDGHGEQTMQCDECHGTGSIQKEEECPNCGGSGALVSGEMEVGGPPERSADDSLELRMHRAAEMEGMFERRGVEGFEMRSTSDGHVRFTGYASTTETPYEISDFRETVARGAFKRTLGEDPDVRLLINHGMGGQLPLARTKSGTLTLSEDARGLRVDADLDPNDPDVRALLPKMRRGDVDEMSFAFRATQQEWNEDYTERLIRECSIHRGDVSIVTTGANPDTTGEITASIRSDDGAFELRVGKQISGANESRLKKVLNRLASIDEEADAGQEELADIIGVPNPDKDGKDNDNGAVYDVKALASEPHTVLPRSAPSYLEMAKARRAKLLGAS